MAQKLRCERLQLFRRRPLPFLQAYTARSWRGLIGCGSAKEVAQIGAAIGREFSHALLTGVARKPGIELQSAVDRLVTAGLIFRQGVVAVCDLLVQTRARSGRRLRHFIARAETRAARSHRGNAREPVYRDYREPA